MVLWLVLSVTGCVTLPDPTHQPQGGALQLERPLVWHGEWSDFRLPGKQATRYAMLQEDGRPIVRAESVASASMLRKRLRRDPGDVGLVKFSWRVNQLMAQADLTDVERADSPVRVVFAFDGDHARLSTGNRLLFDLAEAVSGEVPPFATLMYVWDNHAPLESVIRSGRSDRVRKIVLETGGQHLGQWRHYERDIAADFRRAFGEDPGALISVGLMTDSDNTRSSAEAWYGDVHVFAPAGSSR